MIDHATKLASDLRDRTTTLRQITTEQLRKQYSRSGADAVRGEAAFGVRAANDCRRASARPHRRLPPRRPASRIGDVLADTPVAATAQAARHWGDQARHGHLPLLPDQGRPCRHRCSGTPHRNHYHSGIDLMGFLPDAIQRRTWHESADKGLTCSFSAWCRTSLTRNIISMVPSHQHRRSLSYRPRVRAIREATTLPLLLQGSGVCVSPSERFGIDDELLDDQVNENANG